MLRAWREAGRNLPVLILTARDGWSDKVDGFKAGADDYLTKPFRVEEVVMRLRALVRRAAGHASRASSAGRSPSMPSSAFSNSTACRCG